MQGSPAAWITRALLQAWALQDSERMADALDRAEPVTSDVLYNLIIVTGGTVEAIALAAGKSFEEVLPTIWTQFAGLTGSDSTAEVVRTAVTAWCGGDDSMVDVLMKRGLFEGIDPDTLVMHFLAVCLKLARTWTDELGQPLQLVLDGWWIALGTTGEVPT